MLFKRDDFWSNGPEVIFLFWRTCGQSDYKWMRWDFYRVTFAPVE